MKRWGLWTFVCLIGLMLACVSWIGLSRAGLQFAYQVVSPYLPPELSIQQLEGTLSGPLRVASVRYQQADGSLYQANQVRLQWKPLALLSGVVAVQTLEIKTASVIRVEASAASADSGDVALSLPQISFPLQFQLERFSLEVLNVTQGESEQRFKNIQLSATSLFDQLDIQKLAVEAEDYRISLSGGLRVSGAYRHRLQLEWQYRLAEDRLLNGQGVLQGDLNTSKLSQELSGVIALNVQAELMNLLQQPNWKADIQLSRFDMRQLLADGPVLTGQAEFSAVGDLDRATVQGSLAGDSEAIGQFDAEFDLTASISGPLIVNRLLLTPRASNTRVQAEGEWMPGELGGVVDVDLAWQHLKWPLAGDSWFDSAKGKGHVSGSVQDYQFSVHSSSPWVELPESDWQLDGQGNLEGLVLNEAVIQTLEGEIRGNAEVDWRQAISWKAALSLKDINPAGEWPQWPGSLSGALHGEGRYENEDLSLEVMVDRLNGELRDYPVRVRGNAQWSNQQLQLNNISLQSGVSQVAINGRYADQLDLDYSINSKNLAELYPEVGGALEASGRVTGTVEQPMVSSDFAGSQLLWQDYKIGSAKGQATIDPLQWFQSRVKLDAQRIDLGAIKLQSAQLTASQSAVNARLVADQLTTDIALEGQLQQDRWQGLLTRADIHSERFEDWHLQSNSALSVSAHSLALEQLCWSNDQQATVCASLSGQAGAYRTHIDLKQLSMTLLQPWLPEEVTVQGRMSAIADLALDERQHISGQLRVRLPEGITHYSLTDGGKQRWQYRDGELMLDINQQGVRTQASLRLNENDNVSLSLQLPGASLPGLTREQAVIGEAQIDIRDIHLIESLIPEVQQANGAVKLLLTAKGTLNNPGLKGQVSLEDGSFKVPRLGLDITDVNLMGQSPDLDQMELELSAHSGEGDISVKGSVRLNDVSNWRTQLKLSGKNFEVSRIPEANVRVSPDLDIVIQPGQIDIEGNVHVPYARLNPKDVSSAVQTSNDVVIIGAESSNQQKWKVNTRVRVTLDSEHVRFYGYGFEGDIGGSVLLEDHTGQLTRATGEIRVPQGRYQAYGQRLAIENGRLIYSGGPISNPGLDFKARRVVNEVTAGVTVSGTLLKPKLELYSIPAMGQTDALAYLILGRPMESSSNQDGEMIAKAALALGLSGGDHIARMMQDRFGLDEMRVESSEGGDQASLVVGRYLSPRLYVSYGVGLIESVNTFSLRYQLSSKWQLKAESGENQSADLFYTIER